MGDGRTCPACRSEDLQAAGPPPVRRAVCGHCGRCWEDGGRGAEVDTLTCPGCSRRGTCEACPTPLAESLTRRHLLGDGEEVEIRPLRYGDRFELATAFTGLSSGSRRSRFFDAHDELDPDELEYLTNIDYRDHFACVALLPGRPVPHGVGVGRYVRDPSDPAVAEVAVVVTDDHQRRGIGTLLTRRLGERAGEVGIRTFVCYVLWVNKAPIDMLVAEGARVRPAEPGVARIELDVPARVDDVPDTDVHRIIATFAERARFLGRWLDAEPPGSATDARPTTSGRGPARSGRSGCIVR